jgi:hypothetical protein
VSSRESLDLAGQTFEERDVVVEGGAVPRLAASLIRGKDFVASRPPTEGGDPTDASERVGDGADPVSTSALEASFG